MSLMELIYPSFSLLNSVKTTNEKTLTIPVNSLVYALLQPLNLAFKMGGGVLQSKLCQQMLLIPLLLTMDVAGVGLELQTFTQVLFHL
jgi:hypothetical protein